MELMCIHCCCLVTESCPTLCDPMDCRLLCPWGFPARILEWVAISFCRATYTPMCKIASGNLLYRAESPARCSVVTQRDGLGGGEEEVHEGGDLCTHMANSFCCTAEINTTL